MVIKPFPLLGLAAEYRFRRWHPSLPFTAPRCWFTLFCETSY